MANKTGLKKTIVITSIFHPTEAVHAFSKMSEYNLVVVGDRKTPAGWHCDNVTYLSVEKQSEAGTWLNKILPYNHYSRKMMGYLHAIAEGADLIIDTDDDNIPKCKWSFPDFEGNFLYVPGYKGFVNIYQLYTDAAIWPRGLPLDLVTKKFELGKDITNKYSTVGIWQGLADEDPDVDAIYRLTSDTPCYFNQHDPVVLGKGTISPFNTQNTIIRKELFSLMYLPTHVTFRFTDILRGFVAQPIMWLYDYHLGFVDATVVQKRNPHDYMKDFISEIPMYKHCAEVMDIVIGATSVNNSIEDNLFNAYEGLYKKNIVEAAELDVLAAWLKDLSGIPGRVVETNLQGVQ
ncbi:MAG: STELLO glycosyltransferase family protein [Ferruginibacter sp.]